MQNLHRYLVDKNYTYTNNPDEASGLFFPIACDLNNIRKIKDRGGVIIQRLDGIYYHSKHGEKYQELNHDIYNIYTNYTDHVIFQSEYSRQQCFAMLGEKPKTEYTVIHNGVYTDVFYPNNEIKTGKKYKFITTGNFRNIDMLEPVIEALELVKNSIDLELHVVGPIVNNKLNHLLDKYYIVYHGDQSIHAVAGLLRQCHIFIYSHLNPPCPNSVLEATSTGLPVVGFDSGAMKELCWFSSEMLAPVSEEIFQRYEHFDYRKLADKVMLCVDQYKYYRKIALDHSSLYAFNICGKQYIEVFEKVLKQTVIKDFL